VLAPCLPSDMNEQRTADWDPRAPVVLDDQIRAYDEMRGRCPVAFSETLHWSLFKHEDVVRVLHDHQTFSNQVSRYPSVPNGMDPPTHTAYRQLIEPYFGPAPLAHFEPECRAIARDCVGRLPTAGETEWMDGFAREAVVLMLCAFMGWPAGLREPLREWARKNEAATRSGDRGAMSAVAFEFDGYIRAQLAYRRQAGSGTDVTSRLMRERVAGKPLSDEEIVSIVRNWTVGELATMAASIGILVHYLSEHCAVQQRVREEPQRILAAIDEILRIEAPLIANRRIVSRDVEIRGRRLPAQERVTLMWASANRDQEVFGDPDEFRLDRDPSLNLLYGAGIHVCPGAPLARMELRIVMEAVLAGTRRISLIPGNPPTRAQYPASGYSALPLWTERA
jgi:cytochrome P450